jgi:hypothetical protein
MPHKATPTPTKFAAVTVAMRPGKSRVEASLAISWSTPKSRPVRYSSSVTAPCCRGDGQGLTGSNPCAARSDGRKRRTREEKGQRRVGFHRRVRQDEVGDPCDLASQPMDTTSAPIARHDAADPREPSETLVLRPGREAVCHGLKTARPRWGGSEADTIHQKPGPGPDPVRT